MDGELLAAPVMCHRLRESRIDGKRLGQISDPILPHPGLDLSIDSDAKPKVVKATANQQRSTTTLPCLAAAAPEACDSLAKVGATY